jgi:tRNA pseudouridine55 synthase
VVVDVHCSSGTYVRSLANDIGEQLGIGAHLVGLRRTRSGQFTLRDAVSLRRLREAFDTGDWAQFLIPAAEAISDWYTITLDADLLEKVRHGHRFPAEEGISGWARAVSEQGDLVALLEVVEETHEWQPRKVFFTS